MEIRHKTKLSVSVDLHSRGVSKGETAVGVDKVWHLLSGKLGISEFKEVMERRGQSETQVVHVVLGHLTRAGKRRSLAMGSVLNE